MARVVRFSSLSLVLFTCASMAVASDLFKIPTESGRLDVPLYRYKGARISSFCDQRPCLAKEKLDAGLADVPVGISPMATYEPNYSAFCQKLGGKAVILEDIELNQFNFCQFSDQSYLGL